MNKNTDLVLKDSDQMNTALVAARNTEERLVIAQQMIDSGVIPKSFQEASAVVAACEMGAELGLKPYVALNNIYVIQGRPTLSAASMVALVQAKGVAVKVTEDLYVSQLSNLLLLLVQLQCYVMLVPILT